MIYLISDPLPTPNRTARNRCIIEYFTERGFQIEEQCFSFRSGIYHFLFKFEKNDKFIFQVAPRRNILFFALTLFRYRSIIECRDPIIDYKTRKSPIDFIVDTLFLLFVFISQARILQRKNLHLHFLERFLLRNRVVKSDFGVSTSAIMLRKNHKIRALSRNSAVYAGQVYGKHYKNILERLAAVFDVTFIGQQGLNELPEEIHTAAPILQKKKLFSYIQEFEYQIVINDRGPDFRPSKIYETLCLGVPIIYICVDSNDHIANIVMRHSLGKVYVYDENKKLRLLFDNLILNNLLRYQRISKILFSDDKYHSLMVKLLDVKI